MKQQSPHIVYTRRAPPPRNLMRLLGCLFGPIITSTVVATLAIPLTCILGIPILFMDSSQPSFFGYTAFMFVAAPILGTVLLVVAVIAGMFLGPGWVEKFVSWIYDEPDASFRGITSRPRKRGYSNQQMALIVGGSVIIGACLLCGGLIAFSVWYEAPITIITATPATGPAPFHTFPPLPFPTIDWVPQ
jgi:hypothetical protein